MRISEILSPERVLVAGEDGRRVSSKDEALGCLAELLARARAGLDAVEIERILVERERVQSTGIGSGVAIPHGSSSRLSSIVAAALICPDAIAFEAIDNGPVSILIGMVGPDSAPGEHLKTLAHVSRLMRSAALRELLRAAPNGGAACRELVRAEQGAATPSFV